MVFWWAVASYSLAAWKLPPPVMDGQALLPPSPSSLLPQGCIIAVIACYAVRVGDLVQGQLAVDVVLVDWEAPRSGVLGRSTAPSAWRALLVAAGWARLATARRLNLAAQLFAQVVIVQGAGLQYLSVTRSGATLAPGPRDATLLFAVNGGVWLLLAVVQLAMSAALVERCCGESPTTALLDMAALAKVSIFIVDARYHGWYLHANAPHERADASLAEMAEKLDEEAAAVRAGRGLPGSPDAACQAFEMQLTAAWRAAYDRLFRRLLDAEAAAADEHVAADTGGCRLNCSGGSGSAMTSALGSGRQYGGGGGRSSGSDSSMSASTAHSALARMRERARRLGAGYSALQIFLKGFIGETDSDYRRVWRARSCGQRWLDLPANLESDSNGDGRSGGVGSSIRGDGDIAAAARRGVTPDAEVGLATSTVLHRLAVSGATSSIQAVPTIFSVDDRCCFERVLFRGIEADLCAWDAAVFIAVDWATSSPALSALLTFSAAAALAFMRDTLGRRNMARKTLFDARFLEA